MKQLAGVALALEEGGGDTGVDAGEQRGNDEVLELRAEATALKEQLDAEIKVS